MAKNEVFQNASSLTPQMSIIDGIIKNLPEIIGAFKEVYSIHKKEKAFGNVIKLKIEELHIDRDNFSTLVSALSDLSKNSNADNETKIMYKDMIKIMFDMFVVNKEKTYNLSNFLEKL